LSTTNLGLIFDWFGGEFCFGVVFFCGKFGLLLVVGITMANEGNKSSDFYTILGLKKECTELELKNAYKKLAKVGIEPKCFFLCSAFLISEPCFFKINSYE